MYNTIRIKRRLEGLAGAPGALQNGELAMNEVDSTLYYGASGDNVIAIAGSGSFVNRTSAQSISGVKTFVDGITLPSAPSNNTGAANKGYVDSEINSLSSALQTAINALDSQAGTNINALSAELKGDISSLSNNLTSTINSVSASLDSRITSEIAAVIDSAPELLNTLNELASALGNDESFAVNLTTNLSNINTELDGVSAYAAAQFSNLNTEVDGVSAYAAAQLTNLSNTVISVSSTLDSRITSEVGTLNTTVQSVSSTLDIKIDTRISSLSSTVVANYVEKVESEAVALNGGLTVTNGISADTLSVVQGVSLSANLSGNGSTSTIYGFVLDGGSF